jgi:hypothetical protein
LFHHPPLQIILKSLNILDTNKQTGKKTQKPPPPPP